MRKEQTKMSNESAGLPNCARWRNACAYPRSGSAAFECPKMNGTRFIIPWSRISSGYLKIIFYSKNYTLTYRFLRLLAFCVFISVFTDSNFKRLVDENNFSRYQYIIFVSDEWSPSFSLFPLKTSWYLLAHLILTGVRFSCIQFFLSYFEYPCEKHSLLN